MLSKELGEQAGNDAPQVKVVPANYDWYLYRQGGNAKAIQIAIQGNYLGWTLPDLVVDGKWHHYAFTLAPKADDVTKTSIQF